jgi:hypothetical protein
MTLAYNKSTLPPQPITRRHILLNPQAATRCHIRYPSISLSDIPSTTTWKKLLFQPAIHTDSFGRLLRRIFSIFDTDCSLINSGRPATPSPTDRTLMEMTHPPPTAYTIYVDGSWDTTSADFTTAFQEQRDPTNRQGSAGIAIVPTGPDLMNKDTILITLNDGSQIGSQTAHMELAVIIIELALHRWQLPPQ